MGGTSGTSGTGGIWPCRGRDSLRFSTSFARASRSACRLVIACNCWAMKSDVFGLVRRKNERRSAANRDRSEEQCGDHVPHTEDPEDGLAVANVFLLLLLLFVHP